LHNTGEGHRIIAEFVQRSWQENLGVRIELLNMEWGTLLKTLQAGDFAIGRSSWCADYPDPLTFLEVFHSQSPSNYSGYKSAAYDGLLQQIRSTARHQDRNPLITQAEELLMRELPLLPMYHYTSSTLVKPWVLGLEPNLQDMHPMMYVRFADATEWAQIQRGQPVHLPPLPGPPSAELPAGVTPTAPNPTGSH
jgi:oligopeptide transport system substrate-binding protein